MRNQVIGALIAIVVVGVIPLLITDQYSLGFLVLAGNVSLVVIGLSLLVGYAGQLSLGHGGFYAIGAYISTILTVRYHQDPFLALILAAAATGLIALGLGIPMLRALTHFHLAVATLIFVLLVNAILMVGDEWTGGFTGIQGQPSFAIGPIVFSGVIANYYLIWVAVLLGVVFAAGLGRSQAGRVLRAIQGDEIGAQSLGIDVAWEKVKIFVLSAIYASIAGSLLAYYTHSVTPSQYDVGSSLDFMTMVFLGGKGSVVGGVVGASFLKLLPQFTEFMKDYRLLVNGVILTCVLLFAPQGIVGLATSAWHKLGYSRRPAAAPEKPAGEPPVAAGASGGRR